MNIQMTKLRTKKFSSFAPAMMNNDRHDYLEEKERENRTNKTALTKTA